jgi:hypothetical protein
MSTYVDANGNTVQRRGEVTEILAPGPSLAAELQTTKSGVDALNAKMAANRAALDASARKASRLARGLDPMPTTNAGRDILLKELCEAFARMWFNERFGEEE